MHSLRKPHCLCTFSNCFSPPWVPGLIPFYFRYKHSKRMKGQSWNRGCFLPPHLRGGKGHTGFPTLGGECRSKGTVHTWGRTGKMLFFLWPKSSLLKERKKSGGAALRPLIPASGEAMVNACGGKVNSISASTTKRKRPLAHLHIWLPPREVTLGHPQAAVGPGVCAFSRL